MRAITLTRAAVFTAAVLMLAGCGSKSTTTEDGAAGGAEAGGAESFGTGGSGGVIPGGTPADVAQLRTVFYFDFDQSVVKQEGFIDLERHAAYLASNPNAKVRLEGHADERGTREYNIALGESRANSIARLLLVNGASNGQIETISYGEEKPMMLGHSDSEWALNRRVELSYVSR